MRTKYTIAVTLLMAVVANISLWIYTTYKYKTFLEMKAAYMSYFPNWLANYTTEAGIVFLGVAVALFVQAIQNDYLKKLSIFLTGFSCLLLAWQVFTLM